MQQRQSVSNSSTDIVGTCESCRTTPGPALDDVVEEIQEVKVETSASVEHTKTETTTLEKTGELVSHKQQKAGWFVKSVCSSVSFVTRNIIFPKQKSISTRELYNVITEFARSKKQEKKQQKEEEAIATSSPPPSSITSPSEGSGDTKATEPEFCIIDARRQDEYEHSHIQHAINVYSYLSSEELREIMESHGVRRETLIVTYCALGFRSNILQKKLMHLGYTNVCTLRGFYRWANENKPMYNSKNERVYKVRPEHIAASWALATHVRDSYKGTFTAVVQSKKEVRTRKVKARHARKHVHGADGNNGNKMQSTSA